ncbi:YqgQ family protein [Caldalkalibacillus mannanilyticus]|uniref:YqgQ family protein n=1 Tax=Caldalkalibacillus mannanilyticus TaxID=1418 RepID=UPI000AB3FCE8|nr:YqgQ family protein [Caldalkalibacillus mannanilyticus]
MKNGEITSLQDVRLLLKRFGTFIYSGDPLLDLELMEEEIKELFDSTLIEAKEYQMSILYLKKEMRKYENKS